MLRRREEQPRDDRAQRHTGQQGIRRLQVAHVMKMMPSTDAMTDRPHNRKEMMNFRIAGKAQRRDQDAADQADRVGLNTSAPCPPNRDVVPRCPRWSPDCGIIFVRLLDLAESPPDVRRLV